MYEYAVKMKLCDFSPYRVKIWSYTTITKACKLLNLVDGLIWNIYKLE